MIDQALILVVDDEEGIRELIVDSLTYAGFRVYSLSEGLKVEEYIKTDHPDLIWLDLMLSDIDGFFVLALVKKLYPEIKVICMTAFQTDMVQASADKLKCDRLVAKPFRSIDDIPMITREMLGLEK